MYRAERQRSEKQLSPPILTLLAKKNEYLPKLFEGSDKAPEEIEIKLETIEIFPAYIKLKDENKIQADVNGRFRYPHGAPVGKMILTKVKKDGTPIYKESASEWFDPESPKALEFVWPK